jgi:hypothetical protein
MFAEGVFTEKASLGKEPPVSLKKERISEVQGMGE